MNKQQRELDQQLAEYTDQMEMGLEVDVESYDPDVQELISTVQLVAKGTGAQMPGANTYTRLKNQASAAYEKEFKRNTSLYADDTLNPLQRLFANLRIRPILQYSLIATIIIAAIFLLPTVNLAGNGLTGAAGSDQGRTLVLATIFLIVMFVFWLLNRKSK